MSDVCKHCKSAVAIPNLPYCKNCIEELYERYKSLTSESKHLAMWCMCAELNIPYINAVAKKSTGIIKYIKAVISEREETSFVDSDSHLFDVFVIGKVAKQINGSIDERLEEKQESIADLHEQIQALESENKNLRAEVALIENAGVIAEFEEDFSEEKAVRDWGEGYTVDDYITLYDIYNMYTCEIDNITPAMKFRYQDIAKLELRRRELGANVDPKESKIVADELSNLYKMLGINNFESSQRSNEEKLIDHVIWEMENTAPAEVEDLEKYKDFSGFQEAVDDIYRCMFNAVAGTKNYPNLPKDSD